VSFKLFCSSLEKVQSISQFDVFLIAKVVGSLLICLLLFFRCRDFWAVFFRWFYGSHENIPRFSEFDFLRVLQVFLIIKVFEFLLMLTFRCRDFRVLFCQLFCGSQEKIQRISLFKGLLAPQGFLTTVVFQENLDDFFGFIVIYCFPRLSKIFIESFIFFHNPFSKASSLRAVIKIASLTIFFGHPLLMSLYIADIRL